MNLSDPLYNLREIAKQMILLEEHLFIPGKYCPDCITKHLLTIEGLADEAQCLDKQRCWCEAAKQIGGWSRRWASMFSVGNRPDVIGQEVRAVRKRLAPMVLDPRMIRAKRNPAQLVLDNSPGELTPSGFPSYLILATAVGLAGVALYMYRDKGDATGAYIDKLSREGW